METTAKERILFSPVGNSDPISNCYDGPCLHILRQYRPQRVVLFFTQEIAEREQANHYYTIPIRALLPDIAIEMIFTGITEPQKFDAFLPRMPQELYKLHAQHPEAEILLNISSGTPAMKTILAILSTQETWCRGIQVNNPAPREDRRNDSTTPIEDLMTTNLDNEDGAKNRCEEPALRVLHFYEDKNRIESLIDRYEYHAAFLLSRSNPEIPSTVKTLLEHADLRLRLQTDRAEKVLSKYDGIRLFPFAGRERELVEYFLTIQIDAQKQQLSNVLIKMTPFLYDTLREFVRTGTTIDIDAISTREGKRRILKCSLINEHYPKLLAYLDQMYGRFHDNADLSPLTLKEICAFAESSGETHTPERLAAMNRVLSEFGLGVFRSRNEVAHNITNIDDASFRKMTGMDVQKLVRCFFDVLCQLYPKDNLETIRRAYHDINQWICDALKK